MAAIPFNYDVDKPDDKLPSPQTSQIARRTLLRAPRAYTLEAAQHSLQKTYALTGAALLSEETKIDLRGFANAGDDSNALQLGTRFASPSAIAGLHSFPEDDADDLAEFQQLQRTSSGRVNQTNTNAIGKVTWSQGSPSDMTSFGDRSFGGLSPITSPRHLVKANPDPSVTPAAKRSTSRKAETPSAVNKTAGAMPGTPGAKWSASRTSGAGAPFFSVRKLMSVYRNKIQAASAYSLGSPWRAPETTLTNQAKGSPTPQLLSPSISERRRPVSTTMRLAASSITWSGAGRSMHGFVGNDDDDSFLSKPVIDSTPDGRPSHKSAIDGTAGPSIAPKELFADDDATQPAKTNTSVKHTFEVFASDFCRLFIDARIATNVALYIQIYSTTLYNRLSMVDTSTPLKTKTLPRFKCDTETGEGKYWTTQLNYVLGVYDTLSAAVAVLQSEKIFMLRHLCVMYAKAAKLTALEALLSTKYAGYDRGRFDDSDMRALAHAFNCLDRCLTDFVVLQQSADLIQKAAVEFFTICSTVLQEVCQSDGFLELVHLGTKCQSDVWRMQVPVLYTAKTHTPVPNNYRAFIVDVIDTLRDCGFDAGNKIDYLCAEDAWRTDPAHVYAKLATFFSDARFDNCEMHHNSTLDLALQENRQMCGNDALKARSVHAAISQGLANVEKQGMFTFTNAHDVYASLCEVADSAEFQNAIDRKFQLQTIKPEIKLFLILDGLCASVFERGGIPGVQLASNDGASVDEAITGECQFTAGIDELIRSKLPLGAMDNGAADEYYRAAADADGADTHGADAHESDSGSIQPDEPGSDPEDAQGGAAPGGGNGKKADADNNEDEEDEEDPVSDPDPDPANVDVDEVGYIATWMYSEEDGRKIWIEKETTLLEELRTETDLKRLQFAKCSDLLTLKVGINDMEEKMFRVASDETRLVVGNGKSAYAAQINNSLLVQFLTALVAYNAFEPLRLFRTDNVDHFSDETLVDIAHYIYNRMQVSENSDMSTQIAATLVSYAGPDLISRVTQSLTYKGTRQFSNDSVKYRRVTTSNKVDNGVNAWVPQNSLCDLDVWKREFGTSDARNFSEGQAEYVVVEFVADEGGSSSSSLPNLEHMRDLHRYLLAESSKPEGDRNSGTYGFPLCYCYSLPTGRTPHTVYRIIDSSHQIREQCIARVHFAIFTVKHPIAFQIPHRAVNNMPVRACVLCGFVRSCTDLTYAAFEEHVYAPWYRCASEQFFDMSPVLNIIGDDNDGPKSKFFARWIRPLNLDEKLAVLFKGVTSAQPMSALFQRLGSDSSNAKRMLGDANITLMDLFSAPLDATNGGGGGGVVFQVLQNHYGVPTSDAADVVVAVTKKIEEPVGRLVNWLKRVGSDLNHAVMESAALLNKQRGLKSNNDRQSAPQSPGTKRVHLVKLFLLRACQMVLFNVPIGRLKDANRSFPIDLDDDDDVPPVEITENMSIIDVILMASNRPTRETVDFFQNYPSIQTASAVPTGGDDEYREEPLKFHRAPSERPEIEDIYVPNIHRDTRAAAPAPAAAAPASAPGTDKQAEPGIRLSEYVDDVGILASSDDEEDAAVARRTTDAFADLVEMYGAVKLPPKERGRGGKATVSPRADEPLRLIAASIQDAFWLKPS